MIRFQFDNTEPQTVETPQDVVGLLQKYIRVGVPYTIRVVDDAGGQIVIVSEAESPADEDSTTDL